METLRLIATIVSLITFIGILIWVWRNRNSKEYQESAQLPFTEEDKKDSLEEHEDK